MGRSGRGRGKERQRWDCVSQKHSLQCRLCSAVARARQNIKRPASCTLLFDPPPRPPSQPWAPLHTAYKRCTHTRAHTHSEQDVGDAAWRVLEAGLANVRFAALVVQMHPHPPHTPVSPPVRTRHIHVFSRRRVLVYGVHTRLFAPSCACICLVARHKHTPLRCARDEIACALAGGW